MKSRLFFLFAAIILAAFIVTKLFTSPKAKFSGKPADTEWKAPSLAELKGPEKEEILYGAALVRHTARYLGPRGSVAAITNGMNCQNCHLDGGTRVWGNNYSAVFATYPKFRDRSGTIETLSKRINDCIQRSLNGSPLDTLGKEMQAMIRYINWVGKDVAKGERPDGAGLKELPFLPRAADTLKGKSVYSRHCASCHAPDGTGIKNPADSLEYLYPPLWGANSYNTGSGMLRISRFAAFVKNNMPHLLASYTQPVLTDEEAWDVAAYVNTRPRPVKHFPNDWPNVSKKPVDHPFGPFADGFSEAQHTFGPFQPIADARKNQ